MKKILLTLMVITISFVAFGTINVFAETEGIYTYSVENGKATITYCDRSANGEIVIPDTLGGCPVTRIGENSFSSMENLTGIEFGKNITTIENGAFSWCANLTKVIFSDSVTSVGNYVFQNCTSLMSVEIPDSVTTIGYSLFHSCTRLNNVKLGNGITSINSSMFYGCENLEEIILPERITTIGAQSFFHCKKLSTLDIPDGVNNIGNWAFSGCESLIEMNIPDGIEHISDYILHGCSSLETVVIPRSVTSIGERPFDYCNNLKNVYITDLKAYMDIECEPSAYPTSRAKNLYLNGNLLTNVTIPAGITIIKKGVFNQNANIVSVTIPEGVTTIGESAFEDCWSLKTIKFPNSIKNIEKSAFGDCVELIDVYITDLKSYLSINYADEYSYPGRNYSKEKNLYLNDVLLTEVTIPDGITRIDQYIFRNNKNITSLKLCDDMEFIEYRSFYGCSSLSKITIGRSAIRFDSGVFEGCSSLKYVYLHDIVTYLNCSFENMDASPMRYADKMYIDEKELTNLVVPDGVTQIPDYAFYNYDDLQNVTISDSVITIGASAFEGCSNLENIVIPNSVTSIGNGAFNYSGLTGIIIPETVKNIDGALFNGCYNLKTACIKTELASVEKFMFSNCTNLVEIILPETVEVIGKYAFQWCTSLTKIILPGSITEIEEGVFNACSKLSTVYYNGTQTEWDKININLINNEKFKRAELKFFHYVTLIGNDGEIISKKKYDIGSLIDISDVPSEYTISVFTDETRENAFDLATPVTDNITLYLSYEVNQYVSNFVDEDGTLISRRLFDYGAKIVPPASPKKVGNVQYRYPFAGWEGYTEGMLQGNEELTFKATYNQVVNQYTYKFLDGEGNVLKESKVDYGTPVIPPENPEKQGNAKYTYTFSRWEGLTDGMTVQGDIEFTAIFTETINKYTYRFVDYNNEIISEETVDYGTVITPPQNHTRPSSQQYDYIIIGWTGFEEGMTVSRNISFKAEYREVLRKYIYKFLDDTGSVLKEEIVDYGTVIVPPVEPTKVATKQYTYMFSDWDGYTNGMEITGNVEFVPIFEAIVNKYTYQFVDGEDVIKKLTVDYGTVIELPETPDDKDPYTFDYWRDYVEGLTITDNITFTSVYKYKNYSVAADGLTDIVTVTYNSDYKIEPQIAEEEYSFIGYFTEENGEGTQITDEKGESLSVYNTVGDLKVYPYFESVYMNKIILTETTPAILGGEFTQKLTFATKHNAMYLMATLKYPGYLNFEDISGIDFVEASKNAEKTVEGYKYLDITAIYNYDGKSISKNTKIVPFEVKFSVAQNAPVGDAKIEVDSAVLVGDSDYAFEFVVNNNAEILPMLAERIEIIGSAEIDKATQFSAVVSPDYTTDKSVVWSINDETVATISEDGVLTPVKNGTVVITATAKDGSEVFATKTVNVIAYAKVNSLNFGSGVVLTEFNPDVRKYTVYVKENATSISLTPTFSGGVLRPNGSGVWVSGRSKDFELNDTVTTITLNRENVTDMTNSVYTIEVIKANAEKTTIYENGKTFIIRNDGLSVGNRVYLALYDNERMVDMQTAIYDGEIMILTTEAIYNQAKVLVWEDSNSLRPICAPEIVK